MTSDQIAQQSMAFQQQVMMQNQYAGMLSQNAGSAPMGEQMMGHAANRGMGIGSAVLGGGLALAGMDPMSLAMKAGMGGFASGGMMGAAGAAAGAFLPAYALYQAGSYAGGQVMQGMGQQQQLNATLRQNYQFMGQTGRGFNSSEMGGIGQMMRAQSGQMGPGGEFASMDELTRLAGNMGRMGLSQGVRDAKDFSKKFQEMMTTVKEIATTFSTSLESAQQVMVGMRQSGIFNNQGQVSQQIRQISQAGGVATSEVTGMMNVGSQISRMIGGRGQAGAMGGMKAIAQVGIAQQMGTLSEEQLYNLTGLEGAEGRRALASNMMQESAQFLQTKLGRAFTFAMAGKDGKLDAAAVRQMVSGGGNILGMAHAGVARAGGPAAIMRREGQLRGEVLGQFGMNTDVIAMKSIMESKGLNISGDDDRVRLFMQRKLGVSAEEVDFKLQQMKDLPQLMQRQQDVAVDDRRMRGIEQYRQTQGVGGIKKSLEHFQHKVDSNLQKMGSTLYQEGSNYLERWVMKFTDDYVQMMDKDVGEAVRASFKPSTDRAAAATLRGFGIGVKMRGVGVTQPGVLGGGRSGAVITEGMRERLQGFGYDIGEGAQGAKDAQRVERLSMAFREGSATQNKAALAGADLEELQTGVLGPMAGTQGDKRIAAFGKFLKNAKSKDLVDLGSKWASMSSEQQASEMGTYLRRGGFGGLAATMGGAAASEASGLVWQAGQAGQTAKDMMGALGEYALKGERERLEKESTPDREAAKKKFVEGGEGSFEEGGGGFFGKVARKAMVWSGDLAVSQVRALGYEGEMGSVDRKGKQAKDIWGVGGGVTGGVKEAYGRLLLSEGTRKRIFQVMEQGATASRKQALAELSQASAAIDEAAAGRDLTDDEKAQQLQNRDLTVAGGWQDLVESAGGDPAKVTDAQKKEFQEAKGVSFEEGQRKVGLFYEVGTLKQKQTEVEIARSTREHGIELGSRMTGQGGLFSEEGGKASAAVEKSFAGIGKSKKKGVSSAGSDYLNAMRFEQQAMAKMHVGTNLSDAEREENKQLQKQADDMRISMKGLRAGMSSQDLGQLGMTMGSYGGGEEQSAQAGREMDVRKRMRMSGGGAVGLGRMFGVKDNKLGMFAGMNEDEQAGFLAGETGFKGAEKEGVQAQFKEAIKLRKAGKEGEAAQLLQGIEEKQFGKRKEDEEKKSKEESDKSVAAMGKAFEAAFAKGTKIISGTVEVSNIAQAGVKPPP